MRWILSSPFDFALAPRFGAITASFRPGAQLCCDSCERIPRFDPGEVRQLVAEPGPLPFGVSAGGALCLLYGLIERDLAIEVTHEPGHAVRLHRRQAGRELARGQHSHLVQRTGR